MITRVHACGVGFFVNIYIWYLLFEWSVEINYRHSLSQEVYILNTKPAFKSMAGTTILT